MLHLFFGWGLIALGFVLAGLSVFLWNEASDGALDDVIGPIVVQHFWGVAITAAVSIVFGGLLVLYGPHIAFGIVLLVGGILGGGIFWLGDGIVAGNGGDTSGFRWPIAGAAVVAIAGIAVMFL